ncbi:MAG: hypothetical protein LBR23_04795 [Spirochaetaceae bacterium]|jgi:hypothetical protein|nr:hypothetical protein [Spirochaetaceae bacterium]
MNTRYKDSVFTLLFSDPDRLRELYNALSGSNYGADTPITINTLQDALFMDRCNDISFTIGDRLVVLIEHQSTINANMPLRFLLYIARVYEKITGSKALYRQKRMEIPRPEFVVLYNGEAPQPDQQTLRFSDAYLDVEGTAAPMLDLTVRVYNVNEGHNAGLFAKSGTLEGYAKFVDEARTQIKGKKDEDERRQGMTRAIRYCIERGILKDFLEEHSSEVINMLFTEWNWEDAKEVWQEEARKDGVAIGIQRGREEGREEDRKYILELINSGYSAGELKNVLLNNGQSMGQ